MSGPSQGVILNESSLKSAVDYFLKQDAFYFDCETVGIYRTQPQVAQVTWISLATHGCCITIPMGHERGQYSHSIKVPTLYQSGKKKGQTYNKTVPVYEPAPRQLDTGTVFSILHPLFFNPAIRLGGHDVLFDLVAVSKYWDAVPTCGVDDTKIGYWLLDENSKQNSYLKNMVENRYGHKYDAEGIGACVESYPFSTVAYYSYCDAKYGWLNRNWIVEEIDAQGLRPIYELEMAVLNVAVGMRLAGARIDVEALKEAKEILSKDLTTAEGKIYTAAGHKFNINSNPEKRTVLFQEQGLNPWKKTKGGADSVDSFVLETYPDNPVVAAMGNYAKINKVLSSYVIPWLGTEEEPPLIIDDHIHAGFQQYGTVTGRWSCRSPNLQNIPRPYTDLGSMIRSVFVAEPGGKLVVADYAQIELVVLAHYIGEGKLYEAFQLGIDPHTMTAAMVLGKEPHEVTKVERQDLGKTLGFAVVYGAGIGKVSSMAHLDWGGAKKILRRHAQMFPEIHDFKQIVIDHARDQKPVPYIKTLLGRKRRIRALNSNAESIRQGAERQIFNSLIQGGAGDLNKLSMVRLDGILPPEAKIILTVHDEIVVSCPEHMAQEVAELMNEAMTGEGIQRLVRVPLKADIKIVDRWSEAK